MSSRKLNFLCTGFYEVGTGLGEMPSCLRWKGLNKARLSLGGSGRKEDENVPYSLVRHRVEDYERWKLVFDEHRPAVKQSGSKGGRLLRSADDPYEIVILLEWDNLENARQFYGSDDLRETMQRAGVAGQADIYFLEEVEEVR
jgi:heme-degrading monooxygenase HmoA